MCDRVEFLSPLGVNSLYVTAMPVKGLSSMSNDDVKMPAPQEIRAVCPKCGPDRVAQVMAKHRETGEDNVVWWINEYRIIRCAGCRTIQLQIAHTFSEDYDYAYAPDGSPIAEYNEKHTYWPPLAQRPKPDWFNAIENHDLLLSSILSEVYQALNNDMPIAAATTMRTAFDRVTELLKIDARLPFNKKIQALLEAGEVAERDKEVLEPLIDAGSAAAHRAWRPKADELTTMLLILEALVHRAFVLSKRVKALSKRTPKRKRI